MLNLFNYLTVLINYHQSDSYLICRGMKWEHMCMVKSGPEALVRPPVDIQDLSVPELIKYVWKIKTAQQGETQTTERPEK